MVEERKLGRILIVEPYPGIRDAFMLALGEQYVLTFGGGPF